MTTLRGAREEFDAHFELAKALEDRMMLDAGEGLGNVSLSVRHINTLKSGLVVHLYNILEAIMSQGLEALGAAIGSVDPRKWTEHSLREWLREAVVSRTSEGPEDGRLDKVFETSCLLLGDALLGPQKLKKPSGTWDDKVVALFMQRMSITTNMPAEMWTRIVASKRYGDLTPIQFLARRRNAIAHGRRSFEDGAIDLNLEDIRTLADITLDYVGYTADSFGQHIGTEAYLVPAE